MKKTLQALFFSAIVAGTALSANAQKITVFSGSLTNARAFERPEPAILGDYSRQLSASDLQAGSSTYNYSVQSIVPQSSGIYSIQISSADLITTEGDPDEDTFILLYENNFNPAAPMNNVVAANDDRESSLLSELTGLALTAGKTYYVVVSTYRVGSSGVINFAANGPSSVTVSTLPVRWLGFTAARQAKGVELTWTTATEQSTKDYVVQHSTDGRQWNDLGTVAAAGYSSVVQAYTYLHRLPASEANHYRILQRDIDGQVNYSKVVTVNLSNAQKLQVYPNPVVNGQATVRMENSARVELYNAAGVLVLQKQLPAGTQQLSLGHLPKGLYSLKAGEKTQSLVIQ